MKLAIVLIAALMPSLACAQEPSEGIKIRALKRAYELNGNSMVRPLGQGSIDLSGEDLSVDSDPMGPEVKAEDRPALKKECKLRRGKCRE